LLSSNRPDSEWWRPGPLVIAHRGAARLAPENTLAAFRLAADEGADAVELDARLSADGAVVVHHDATLNRTTNGTGDLSELDLNDLKSLDAGAKFDARFAGEQIPVLDEVFEAIGRQILINVELKNYERVFDPLAEYVVRIIRHHGLERWVLLSSFNPVSLRAVSRLAPEIPRGLLLWQGQKQWTQAVFRAMAVFDACHPHDRMTDREAIAADHAHGRRVNVWTVNDVDRMRELLLLGADGLITDAPRLARQAVQDVAADR